MGGPARLPLHEYLNAVTMVFPNLVGVWYCFHWIDPSTSLSTPMPYEFLCVTLGTAFHMVAAVAFHVSNAMHLEEGVWDEDLKLWIMPCGRQWHPTAHNSYRRLDQSFIHFTGLLYTVAYNPHPAFLITSLSWNVYCVYYIWKCDPESRTPPYCFESNLKAEGPRRRIIHIAIASGIYLFALFSAGYPWHSLYIFTTLILAVAVFTLQPIIGGYGHAVFHLVLIWFYKCNLDAAMVIATKGGAIGDWSNAGPA